MNFATLYEQDIETWAELQVAALRRLASTPGPWSNIIDWENVIEEIEDLGSQKREAAESLLGLVFVHLLKLRADPGSMAADHWRVEITNFLKRARTKAARSMRARIDLDRVWCDSLKEAERSLRSYHRSLPADTPRRCPFTFDELLDAGFDPLDHGLLARPRDGNR